LNSYSSYLSCFAVVVIDYFEVIAVDYVETRAVVVGVEANGHEAEGRGVEIFDYLRPVAVVGVVEGYWNEVADLASHQWVSMSKTKDSAIIGFL
jgi:hypothetical protein